MPDRTIVWHKRTPIRGATDAVINVWSDGDIELRFEPFTDTGRLTINAAGDLAHALGEALGHAGEALTSGD